MPARPLYDPTRLPHLNPAHIKEHVDAQRTHAPNAIAVCAFPGCGWTSTDAIADMHAVGTQVVIDKVWCPRHKQNQGT